MADLLADIQAYFTAAGLVDGAFFLDASQDTPDKAITVYEYTGETGIPQVASVLRSVQVVARDKAANAARVKANSLYKALQTEDGILQLTAERWCMISLRQPPFKMKVDSAGRTYYCFNVGITTYED